MDDQSPLTAAFLGANYWAASFLAFFSLRERIWVNARLTYVVSIVFITLTMVATLLHLDKFQFDNANGWLWTIVYVGVPPLLLILIVQQFRSRMAMRRPVKPRLTGGSCR